MVVQWFFICLAMVLMEWKNPKSLILVSGEFGDCVMKTQDQPSPLQPASKSSISPTEVWGRAPSCCILYRVLFSQGQMLSHWASLHTPRTLLTLDSFLRLHKWITAPFFCMKCPLFVLGWILPTQETIAGILSTSFARALSACKLVFSSNALLSGWSGSSISDLLRLP